MYWKYLSLPFHYPLLVELYSYSCGLKTLFIYIKILIPTSQVLNFNTTSMSFSEKKPSSGCKKVCEKSSKVSLRNNLDSDTWH